MILDSLNFMRKPRIKPNNPEAFYHVMTRTSQCVFNLELKHDPEIKEICDQIIKKMATIYHVEIYAWVFMDNHIHLCLSVRKPTIDEADIAARFDALQEVNVHCRSWFPWLLQKFYRRFCDLSWFMWEIKTRIARAFNKRHQTSGYFWGGRFKSKLIEDEAALLRVMSYIEQNPVRAGCCERPSDFKWCSAGQTKIKLLANKSTTIPAIGPFGGFSGRQRAQAYIDWMDYQAVLILNPQKKQKPPPAFIANICLKGQELVSWRQDFQIGGPSKWGTQGYGSAAFEKIIREIEDKRILALAYQRYVVSRNSRDRSIHGRAQPFHGSGSWWYGDGCRNEFFKES